MTEILDAALFPFDVAEGRELLVALVTLFPTNKSALVLAERAGIPVDEIEQGSAPRYLWFDILKVGAAVGANRRLVEDALRERAKSPLAGKLKALLAGEAFDEDPQPRASDGSVAYIGVATVPVLGREEALLFHDDVSMSIGQIEPLILALKELLKIAPAVCRLRIEAGPIAAAATGFRIGQDLVLTNHHVLHPRGYSPTSIRAEFHYESDAEGRGRASNSLPGHLNTVVSDPADDWGVFRVDGMDETIPIVDVAAGVDATRGDASYIVHHPDGDRKRASFVRNTIMTVGPRTFFYLTDTRTGSSGSPVLASSGRLMGLHARGGLPEEDLGKGPVALNEGVRISIVTEGLRRHGLVV